MNASWQDLLGTAGARFDNGLVSGFGDPAGERLAARDGTIVAPLAHLGLIECRGEDARAFLHNQLTSDVNHLATDVAQHAAWCSAKGRMLASFLLWRRDDAYCLRLAADLAPAILKRLQMFVLRSRVQLVDAGQTTRLLGLAGPQAAAALQAAGLQLPDAPMKTAHCAGGTVVRLDEVRFEIAANADTAGELWRALAEVARPVGGEAWQWLEIAAGIPLISAATREEFVPQMANFERIGGVSFHKGCYPGQEVVARTQYLGKVKRHLYRARAEVPLSPGAALFSPEAPEQACGMLVNTAPAPEGGHVALAVIQESHAASGQVALGAPDGPPVTVVPVAA